MCHEDTLTSKGAGTNMTVTESKAGGWGLGEGNMGTWQPVWGLVVG